MAEIVFALGLGDEVVATDLSATYPPAAGALPEIGYQRALNAEPILAFEPTVLIGTDLAGPPGVLDELAAAGLPPVIVPSEPDPTGPAEKIRAVAAALDVDGKELATTVQRDIDAATVDPATVDDPPRVLALYVRGEGLQLVFGPGSGIHWLIEAAGGHDVGADLGVVDNAPLTAEAIVAAAPDVIVVPEVGLQSVGGVDGLLGVAGLGATPAGEAGAVLAYDDQLMLGNGPRTGEFLARLADDLGDLI